MLRHGFIVSLLLVGSFVLLATLASIKTMAERPTFASDIKPILESRCQPCHFQGGQMYEKLPFDKPETITKLGTKLFTRIKDEDQQRVIREFLSEQSAERGSQRTRHDIDRSVDCVSAIDAERRTIWIADAHRDDGKRFIVHADGNSRAEPL